MFPRKAMWVSRKLCRVVLASSLLVGCASSQTTPAEPTSASEDKFSIPTATLDERVYSTFAGTDAEAMAKLGERLERERPPLKTETVERMLAFLKDHPEDAPPLQMLRPMLFRSAAVVVGQPASPILQRCTTEAPSLAQLCQETLQELSGTPK
jgi:hypothetical protein